MNVDYPYFAQWLPVEGEIIEGDYYKVFSLGLSIRKKWAGRGWNLYRKGYEKTKLLQNINRLIHEPYRIRVKLFLCSYDIQPGDDYMFLTYDENYVETRRHNSGPLAEHWFKKLKKISPEAGWVKEGDKFTKGEILPWNSLLEIPIDNQYMSDPEPGNIAYIKIFNHSCRHFH